MARNKSPNDALAQNLKETKLAIDKARLAKLEDALPKPALQYTSYEELPPLPPEERAILAARFTALYERLKAQDAAQKQAWLLSMTDYAP